VPTIAKMVESFIFSSRDSRSDETLAQSTVIWDKDIDWSAWNDGCKETTDNAGKLESQSDVTFPL